MARHRTYSIEFKRQVAQEYLGGGESLNGLAKRHGICRNLIRVWVAKYEEGAFSREVETADLLQEYEGRIAALERLVGRLTLENELLKKAHETSLRRTAVTSSIITGPLGSPSAKDAT